MAALIVAILLLRYCSERVFADNMVNYLRCESNEGFERWESALRYGDVILDAEIAIDGRLRRVRYYEYDRKLLLFVFGWPELPGVREPGAWHGCGMYEIPWWH